MNALSYEREKFFSRLIWLFPLAYVLHITEESHGFADWVTQVIGGKMRVSVFYINNAVFMVILLTLCTLASRKQKTWSTFLLFLWTSAQIFWNFVFHIYAEFSFNAYSPGYFTAIFLYFPVYSYLSYLCLREHFLSWPLWLTCFVVSWLGMAFTIWGGLYHFGPIPWDRWMR